MKERMKPSEIQQYIAEMEVLAEQQGASAIADIIEDMTASPAAGSLKRLNKSVYGPDVLEDITKLSILEKIYFDKVGDDAATAAENAADSAEEAAESAAKIPGLLANDNALDVIMAQPKTDGTSYGITYTWNADGTCTVTGASPTGNTNYSTNVIFNNNASLPVGIAAGQAYRVVFSRTAEGEPVMDNPNFVRLNIRYFDSNGSNIDGTEVYITGSTAIVVPSNAVGMWIRLFCAQNADFGSGEVVTAKILTAWSFTVRELNNKVQHSGEDLIEPGVYFTDTRSIGGVSKRVIADFPFGSGYLVVFPRDDNTVLQLAYDSRSLAIPMIRTRTRTSGCSAWEYVGKISGPVADSVNTDFSDADFLLTDFTVNDGVYWYKLDGDHSASGATSTLIPVTPGSKLYGTWFGSPPAQACGGAFFDERKTWIAPVCFPVGSVDETLVNASVYDCYPANVAPGATSSYADLWEITVPADAWYIALNLRITATANTRNCQSISTIPMLGATGTGNYIWRKNDPRRAVKKGKKLYIIGQSTTGIDRLFRTIYNAATGAAEAGSQQPIVGWQEYLIPYYGEVVSLGFPGIGYPTVLGYITEHNYTGYSDNPLSDADEVLICVGTNDMTVSTIGEWNSTDTDTWCGSVNALIDEIYDINSGENASNKHPVTIYLSTYEAKCPEGKPSWAVVRAANEAARQIAEHRDLVMIDCEKEIGINAANHPFLSYDANSLNIPYGMHMNNAGNKIRGDYFVKKLIGG